MVTTRAGSAAVIALLMQVLGAAGCCTTPMPDAPGKYFVASDPADSVRGFAFCCESENWEAAARFVVREPGELISPAECQALYKMLAGSDFTRPEVEVIDDRSARVRFKRRVDTEAAKPDSPPKDEDEEGTSFGPTILVERHDKLVDEELWQIPVRRNLSSS